MTSVFRTWLSHFALTASCALSHSALIHAPTQLMRLLVTRIRAAKRASANDFPKRGRWRKRARPWRERGQGAPQKQILTQWLGSVSSALASAHRAIHIRGPGSRPGPRIAIGGRPLTAAVARGGAQSRSQKLALRAAPRYQHRCQNGLPWPTEVFFQEGGMFIVISNNEKSKWVLACLFEEKTAGFCLTPMFTLQ